jgi:hypothetical protein
MTHPNSRIIAAKALFLITEREECRLRAIVDSDQGSPQETLQAVREIAILAGFATS